MTPQTQGCQQRRPHLCGRRGVCQSLVKVLEQVFRLRVLLLEPAAHAWRQIHRGGLTSLSQPPHTLALHTRPVALAKR